MDNKCPKCNTSFASKYNLQKHLERKIPCDRVLQCDRCKKIFARKSNLTTHLNRKNPCKTKEEELDLFQKKLDFEKEKAKIQEEKKIKILNEENKLKIEILEKENEMKINLEEKKIERIEKRKKAEIEISIAEKENRMEIEKEKTKQIIERRTIITNNTVNNTTINISAPTINMFNCDEKTLDNHIETNLLTMKFNTIDNLLQNCKTEKDFIVKLLAIAYNNDNFPECKNIIYVPPNDKFYIISDNNWIEKKYENIHYLLSETITKLAIPFANKYDQALNYNSGIEFDRKLIMRTKLQGYGKIKPDKKNIKEDMEKYAEEALSEQETIEKVQESNKITEHENIEDYWSDIDVEYDIDEIPDYELDENGFIKKDYVF